MFFRRDNHRIKSPGLWPPSLKRGKVFYFSLSSFLKEEDHEVVEDFNRYHREIEGLKSLSASVYPAKRGESPFKKGEQFNIEPTEIIKIGYFLSRINIRN